MNYIINDAKVTTISMTDARSVLWSFLKTFLRLMSMVATLRMISYVSKLDQLGHLDSMAQRPFLLRASFKANG